jgi:hypothetical protein
MMDFLGRLAASELGSLPALAPRVPSLFEGDSREAPLQEEESRVSAPAVADGRVPEERGSTGRVQAMTAHIAASTPVPGSVARAQARDDREVVAPEVRVRAADERVHAESPALRRVEEGSGHEIARGVEPARAAIEPRADVSGKPALLAVEPETVSGSRVLAPQSRVLEAVVAPQLVQPVSRAAVPNELDRSSRADQVPLRAQGEREMGSQRSETVVQITIGRLEVRASPASATVPQRKRTGAEPMQLDAYLRGQGRARHE